MISNSNICWVVTDGKPGMENQALGLAEALGLKTDIKRIHLKSPWRQLSPYFRWGLKHCLSNKSDLLAPPWPDYVVASGRQSIAPSLYIKEQSQGKTKTIYIQKPGISLKNFDIIVAPKHDSLTGPNVIQTYAALHRVTPERCREEKGKFSQFGNYPSPRIAVLIGGG